MTPKEKAKELVSKFTFYQLPEDKRILVDNAKQCALICLNQMKDDSLSYGDVNAEDWLKEVKQEINKLL